MCLKIALYSLFEQPGFCLIFISSKNKSFQPGALLKSFHGKTWTRYSEINNFKLSEDLSFQKLQNKDTKKMQVSKITSSKQSCLLERIFNIITV